MCLRFEAYRHDPNKTLCNAEEVKDFKTWGQTQIVTRISLQGPQFQALQIPLFFLAKMGMSVVYVLVGSGIDGVGVRGWALRNKLY